MKVFFIHHSSFLVESESCYLLFDYFEGTLPALEKDKPLYILASHSHADHFSEAVFQEAQPFHEVRFILSSDIFKSRVPMEYRGVTCHMKPHVSAEFPHLSVETLLSTDKGVAFLVEVDGRLLYHAGDLNCWVWAGEPAADNDRMRERYLKELERLEHKDIFAAFVPLDPRQEEDYALGMRYFFEYCGARHAFPMHMWNDFQYVDTFLRDYPEYADRVHRIRGDGQIFNI